MTGKEGNRKKELDFNPEVPFLGQIGVLFSLNLFFFLNSKHFGELRERNQHSDREKNRV